MDGMDLPAAADLLQTQQVCWMLVRFPSSRPYMPGYAHRVSFFCLGGCRFMMWLSFQLFFWRKRIKNWSRCCFFLLLVKSCFTNLYNTQSWHLEVCVDISLTGWSNHFFAGPWVKDVTPLVVEKRLLSPGWDGWKVLQPLQLCWIRIIKWWSGDFWTIGPVYVMAWESI